MEDLIKKQEEAFEMMKQFNGVLFANETEEIKNFISTVRKESIEFERKRIKKIIENMPLYGRHPHLNSKEADSIIADDILKEL